MAYAWSLYVKLSTQAGVAECIVPMRATSGVSSQVIMYWIMLGGQVVVRNAKLSMQANKQTSNISSNK